MPMKLNKTTFYILSFTWGLPLTLIGCLLAAAMLISGHKPRRCGWAWYFTAGEYWGGMEGGPFFIRDRCSSEHITCHEYGHAIQNCFFGPFMLLLVTIPSGVRYWYRRLYRRWGRAIRSEYDRVWFEGQATRLGIKYTSLL
ncbi:MAG: hypothetical protein IJG63_01685 [Oscillospiraceae bacterium]|nr:hypothetical protein [Oscillospiraceae bacterium]